MLRITALLFLSFLTCAAWGQKGAQKTVKKRMPAPADTVAPAPVDTVDHRAEEIRASRKFAVYSKKQRMEKSVRTRLCIQLVEDTVLTYCMNDSICRDPEFYKILFQRHDGDTSYVLVLVDAFSKPADKPDCDAGKESKLFFARWNTKKNNAIWKQRTFSSCMKGITNMSAVNAREWNGEGPLQLKYHRGGLSFVEIQFDPANYKRGIETVSDTDNKARD